MTATTNGQITVTPGRPKRPESRKIMPPMPAEPAPDASTDDFLKFWDQFRTQEVQPTTTILGVVVEIPTDVPLYFDDLQRRMSQSKADSESDEARALYEEMLALLFGEGTLDKWKETRKLTGLMLRVLVAWGIRNANSVPTTFEQAGELVVEAIKAEAEGKPSGPNRAARRKPAVKGSSTTRGSGTTGQPSRRTSRASTARKPKT